MSIRVFQTHSHSLQCPYNSCEVDRVMFITLIGIMLRGSGAAMTPGIHHMSDVACSDTQKKSNRL